MNFSWPLYPNTEVEELFCVENIKAKGTMESNALLFSRSKKKYLLLISQLVLNVVKRNVKIGFGINSQPLLF